MLVSDLIMQRPRAPFWAVDVAGLLVVGALCIVGKIGGETAVVIIIAVLGFGAMVRASNNQPPDPPADPPAPNQERATTVPPRSRRSRPTVPSSGLVGLLYAVLSRPWLT